MSMKAALLSWVLSGSESQILIWNWRNHVCLFFLFPHSKQETEKYNLLRSLQALLDACFPYLSPPVGTVWHFLCSNNCSGVFMNLWHTSHSNIRVIRWICRWRSNIFFVLQTKLQKTHSKPFSDFSSVFSEV